MMDIAETEIAADSWMLLELMGRRRLAGRVREVTIAGAGFLRVDVFVPEATEPQFTQFIPPGTLYAITPITEDVARRFAAANQVQPITPYEVAPPRPTRPMLPPDEDYYRDDQYE